MSKTYVGEQGLRELLYDERKELVEVKLNHPILSKALVLPHSYK